MALELVWLILFLCLLITIIKYTLGAILKWSVPGAKARKDLGFQPTVPTRKFIEFLQRTKRSPFPKSVNYRLPAIS